MSAKGLDKPERKAAPKSEDFGGLQLDLFRNVLCNTEGERDALSNVLDLWDSIPRYAISRQQQDKWRRAGTFPALYEQHFHYRGRGIVATIQPATLKRKDGSTANFYPSANEELIEDVLRKIATDQNNGYYIPSEKRHGVVFTLHLLRKELDKRGHGRTYQEISDSLDILSGSIITTKTEDGKDGNFLSRSVYLNNLFRVTKGTRELDPDAKWFADFHPFASRALDEVTYRQFNYARLMSHKSQLARWLNKVLCLKYLNASHFHPFDMYFSTIVRDSGLLNGYSVTRLAVAAVDDAFRELATSAAPMLATAPKKDIKSGPRGKIMDVIYTLQPSNEFIKEVKAASKRQDDASRTLKPVNNPVLLR